MEDSLQGNEANQRKAGIKEKMEKMYLMMTTHNSSTFLLIKSLKLIFKSDILISFPSSFIGCRAWDSMLIQISQMPISISELLAELKNQQKVSYLECER